jgi:hypothetical protein
MESGLTSDQIRQAVQTYVPERLDSYDAITAQPLISEASGTPLDWTDEMRMSLFLNLWRAYDATRPN